MAEVSKYPVKLWYKKCNQAQRTRILEIRSAVSSVAISVENSRLQERITKKKARGGGWTLSGGWLSVDMCNLTCWPPMWGQCLGRNIFGVKIIQFTHNRGERGCTRIQMAYTTHGAAHESPGDHDQKIEGVRVHNAIEYPLSESIDIPNYSWIPKDVWFRSLSFFTYVLHFAKNS